MALVNAFFIFMVSIVATAWATFHFQCSPSLITKKLRGGGSHAFYSGPIRDHILRDGRTYRNATCQSHMTCAIFCLQDVRCRSFNFCSGAKLCELNSDVYATDKSDLQPSSGCLYFDEDYHKECVAVKRLALNDLNFKFYPLKSNDSFRLDFAIKGNQFPFLSLSEFVNEENYHLIMIGSHSNTATTISCGHCSPRHIYNSVPSDGILSEFEYRRFWLSYNNGDIQVGKWGDVSPVLQWRDEHHNVTVNYVGISSLLAPVSWILYDFCNA